MRPAWLIGLLAFGCAEQTLVRVEKESPATVIIRDVSVLDVVTGSVAVRREVRISGDRIQSIGPSEDGSVEGAHVIDGRGRTLVPGLIDMHCHTASRPAPPWSTGLPDPELNLARLLYSGVTTVFDPGGHDEDVFERRAAIARGALIGPRVYAAGPVFTTPGGHPVFLFERLLPSLLSWYLIPHMTRQVGTPEAARAAVAALAPSRPDFIKMAIDRIPLEAPRLSQDVARSIVEEANAQGVRAVAHIGTATDAIDAAEAGVALWIHHVYKGRLSPAEVRRLKGFGIPMVSTMTVFDSYAGLGRERRQPTRLERQVVPVADFDALNQRPDDYEVDEASAAMLETFVRERETGLYNVERLYRAGVTIFAGSDAQAGVYHGPSLHRELAMLRRAGLPTMDVIRAATLYPARFLTRSEDPPFGIIAEGKQADLVLVEGDPREDITALERIVHVISAGRVLQRTPVSDK